jgi:hypothetical protein
VTYDGAEYGYFRAVTTDAFDSVVQVLRPDGPSVTAVS